MKSRYPLSIMSKKIRPASRMSYRLRHWDYASNAPYFITICTQNRKHFFGEISDGKMHLSDIGKIVENEWIKTPNIRPEMQLKLGEFVVMPNHFHAILIIGRDATPRGDAVRCVPTYKNKFGPQSNNLASIIRGFKSAVTTQVKNHIPVGTQCLGGTQCLASSHHSNGNPDSTTTSSTMPNHLPGLKNIL